MLFNVAHGWEIHYVCRGGIVIDTMPFDYSFCWSKGFILEFQQGTTASNAATDEMMTMREMEIQNASMVRISDIDACWNYVRRASACLRFHLAALAETHRHMSKNHREIDRQLLMTRNEVREEYMRWIGMQHHIVQFKKAVRRLKNDSPREHSNVCLEDDGTTHRPLGDFLMGFLYLEHFVTGNVYYVMPYH
jgi:hypothetical protein